MPQGIPKLVTPASTHTEPSWHWSGPPESPYGEREGRRERGGEGEREREREREGERGGKRERRKEKERERRAEGGEA